MGEDSVRRARAKINEAAGVEWLQRHLDYTFRPLLGEPWILDVDTTVKPLSGRQEGAVIGYNPPRPGRPSHPHHSYAIAGLRLMLEVEGQAGNQHAAKHSAPGLWALPARLGRAAWPQLLRGDGDWGTEANMSRAEREGLAYVTSTHGRAGRVRRMLAEVVTFFKSLRPIAEQLSGRWSSRAGPMPATAGRASRRACGWWGGAGSGG